MPGIKNCEGILTNLRYSRIWCFGDSWGYGSELDFSRGEMPFASLLARELGIELHNFSEANLSLGLITRNIATAVENFSKDDLILIVIPPDSRWYTEWGTLDYQPNIQYFIDKSNDWFEYHHQLFIFSICEMLDKKQCQYLLMHNYGKFPLAKSKYYFSNHHQHRFLDQRSLTELLVGMPTDQMRPIQIELTQSQQIFRGPYFDGCVYHPNQSGHQFIADKIKERLIK